MKIGCLEGSAADCLKNSYVDESFICPVFEDQQCDLYKDGCEYSGKVNCNGIRQLRCETLIAIYDYLHSNETQKTVYQILSAEHGHSYFNSITQYLKRRFKIEDSPWEKVAFMNLLQRYVPYRGMEENNLYNYTKDTDVFFTLDIIKELSPTYIIVTMKYVANELLGEIKGSADSQKWFKDKYEIIEDENGFILLKVKGKDARVLLSNLKSESVFNGFLRFYKELHKPSLRILVCTFLYYSNKYFQGKYKEYNINMSMIRNILLDHIVVKKEYYKKFGTDNDDISKLLELLDTNKAFSTFANKFEEDKLITELKNKENSKVARRNLCRKIDNYGNQTSEMAIKLNNIFSQILSDIPDSSFNKG